MTRSAPKVPSDPASPPIPGPPTTTATTSPPIPSATFRAAVTTSLETLLRAPSRCSATASTFAIIASYRTLASSRSRRTSSGTASGPSPTILPSGLGSGSL